MTKMMTSMTKEIAAHSNVMVMTTCTMAHAALVGRLLKLFVQSTRVKEKQGANNITFMAKAPMTR